MTDKGTPALLARITDKAHQVLKRNSRKIVLRTPTYRPTYREDHDAILSSVIISKLKDSYNKNLIKIINSS